MRMKRLIAVALASLVVGLLVGTWLGERNQYPVRLAYCAVAGQADGPTRPCPPRPGTPVIATWGALTTRAVWTGQMWRFDGQVLGQRESLVERLEADPDFYDAKCAGWWLYGASGTIAKWANGAGPWHLVDGKVRLLPHLGNAGRGVNRQLPHLGNAGRGVNRQLPHLGDAGRGVNRQLPHLGDAGQGVDRLTAYMRALSARLRRVRITRGDFERVLGPSVTTKHGLTGVLLDPPYDQDVDQSMYANYDLSASARARAWALETGDDPLLRIALCGYEGEHNELLRHGWTVEAWNGRKGYQSVDDDGGHTGQLERIWFSPHCLQPNQARLFAPEIEAQP